MYHANFGVKQLSDRVESGKIKFGLSYTFEKKKCPI